MEVSMRKLTVIAGLAAALLAAPAWAQALISGEITKVDPEQGKLTIKHEAIKKFDMDGMTMVFKAADPAMLKSVKVGDKIKFDVDKVNGQMTLTKLEKAK
jgi:Cu(I)/Ag(I) efflux system protein CusF